MLCVYYCFGLLILIFLVSLLLVSFLSSSLLSINCLLLLWILSIDLDLLYQLIVWNEFSLLLLLDFCFSHYSLLHNPIHVQCKMWCPLDATLLQLEWVCNWNLLHNHKSKILQRHATGLKWVINREVFKLSGVSLLRNLN